MLVSSTKLLQRPVEKLLCAIVLLLAWYTSFAQDLVVTNARIIDGTGLDIENGTIVIENGRIASISEEAIPLAGRAELDACGMTALPAYIDAHRHVIRGDAEHWLRNDAAAQMQEFLDAGFTTLMSGADPIPEILELKEKIDSKKMPGPRIITSGWVDLRNVAGIKAARGETRSAAEAGVDIIKIFIASNPTTANEAQIIAVVDEAKNHGLDVMAHATSLAAITTAIATGVTKLVHTPHGSYLSDADAQAIADAGVDSLSTAGFGVPVFGVFNDDNTPTFRDGGAWPDSIPGGQGRGREAGEKIVNARTLWDAGVNYGFGTDTQFHPRDGHYHELKALHVMFSPADIIRMMGPNTAAFLEMENDLGAIAPGSLADIVLVDGDPLQRLFTLLDVRVVLKEGVLVTDKRHSSRVTRRRNAKSQCMTSPGNQASN